jgi:methionyl-tRNA formyltransferase
VQALADAQADRLVRTPQPAEGITYAHKIEKHEAALDWRLSAKLLAQRVRAFNPFPVATLQTNGEVIKVWSAHVEEMQTKQAPGTVLSATEHGVCIACGEGVLRINELQKAGGKRLHVAEFLRGFDITVGSVCQGATP